MASSFFFYDLETTGFDPRQGRVMQFAGQRTDLNLQLIGEPINELIKLTPDVLPSPDAVLVTGITPQQTLTDGLTEAEFLKLFYREAVKPDTIFIGFNTIRFDDEFMRFLLYRNFYDAYEWQWKDGCSRWDLLDVARMTRALRPDGIEWPFAPDGKPTNRLEFLTAINKLDHGQAHDALSDVKATIAIAQLIKSKQPEMFKYLLETRGKPAIKKLVLSGQPFVYTTGRYSSQFAHTSAAVLLDKHPEQEAALVYDLRYDPTPFLNMSIDELIAAWRFNKDPDALRLPVKTIKFNRCPAVAPLGVIKDQSTQEMLELPLETITKHLAILTTHRQEFVAKIHQVVDRLDTEREQKQATLVDNELTVDERLYDGFINKTDTAAMHRLRTVDIQNFGQTGPSFSDQRLNNLLPLYKARNFPSALNPEERTEWDKYLSLKLLSGGAESPLAKYFVRLQELADAAPTEKKKYLLEELRLYGESIMPADADG